MARKIIVTGGAGFIGSNFIRYMLSKYPYYEIVNYDKLTYAGNKENLKDLEGSPNYEFVHGDINDLDKLVDCSTGVDAVINFAAESHVDRSISSSREFIVTNVLGVETLMELARYRRFSRFIQISTDEVYGSIDKGSFKESDRLMPSSPYSASKAAADLLVHSYCVTHDVPAIIVRSTNNFGPYQYPEKLIPLFVTNALEDKPLPLYGDGLNVRDWLFAEDNCAAIDAILHKGIVGQRYNVGAGNEIPNIEIAGKILQILGKPESLIRYVDDRLGHDRRYSVDTAKVRKLGWKPDNDFDAALEKTVKWYVDNRDWWEKLQTESGRGVR